MVAQHEWHVVASIQLLDRWLAWHSNKQLHCTYTHTLNFVKFYFRSICCCPRLFLPFSFSHLVHLARDAISSFSWRQLKIERDQHRRTCGNAHPQSEWARGERKKKRQQSHASTESGVIFIRIVSIDKNVRPYGTSHEKESEPRCRRPEKRGGTLFYD